MPKKIVIKFYENDTIKKIKCQNCVQSNVILAGNKLIAKAKKLPEKRKMSIFKRFVLAIRYAFGTTSVDTRYCKHLKNVQN